MNSNLSVRQMLIHEGGFLVLRTGDSGIVTYTFNGKSYTEKWQLEKEQITSCLLVSPFSPELVGGMGFMPLAHLDRPGQGAAARHLQGEAVPERGL